MCPAPSRSTPFNRLDLEIISGNVAGYRIIAPAAAPASGWLSRSGFRLRLPDRRSFPGGCARSIRSSRRRHCMLAECGRLKTSMLFMIPAARSADLPMPASSDRVFIVPTQSRESARVPRSYSRPSWQSLWRGGCPPFSSTAPASRRSACSRAPGRSNPPSGVHAG